MTEERGSDNVPHELLTLLHWLCPTGPPDQPPGLGRDRGGHYLFSVTGQRFKDCFLVYWPKEGTISQFRVKVHTLPSVVTPPASGKVSGFLSWSALLAGRQLPHSQTP